MPTISKPRGIRLRGFLRCDVKLAACPNYALFTHFQAFAIFESALSNSSADSACSGVAATAGSAISSYVALADSAVAVTTLTNITRAGSQFANYAINVTVSEAQAALQGNGFIVTKAQQAVTILSNGDSSYAFYIRSSGGLGMVFTNGISTIKYTLSGP